MAALCRDENGNYLGSSAVFYEGVIDPTVLETFSCREGLALAEDLDVHDVVLASDCEGVVNDINWGTSGPNAAITHEIIARSSGFSSCKFIFERRNFNLEVHNLAKYAYNLGIGRDVWLDNPHNPTIVPMNMCLNQ